MLLYLIAFCSFFGNIDYAQVFGEDYQKAVDYCIQNKEQIKEKAVQYNLPAAELTAIVFPELVRHSSFQDFFETAALELVYVSKGKEYANFSIGQFQMKPSFVEKLEATIKKNDSLKQQFKSIISYPNVEDKTKRKIRLERLKNQTWQLDYLCCFYSITTNKFANELGQLSPEMRLKYLATAYNCGFDKSWETIGNWTTRACYPYGVKYPENQQYIYANIAWDFFENFK